MMSLSHQHQPKHSNRFGGFAHLLLLLVFAVVAAVVGYFVLKNNDVDLSQELTNLYTKETPTLAPVSENQGLEYELNKIEDEDDSSGFSEVDKDIQNL